MSDLETRIPELLHDLVSQLPQPGRDLERHTLRRARRRRATNASLTAVLAVALVVVGMSGLRALRTVAPSIPGVQTPTPSPSSSPTTPADSLPAAVAATRDAVLAAARGRDLSALSALIGPRFSFNFGVPDPIGVWREDTAPLDTLVKILDMPFAINREGGRSIYMWPFFTQADLSSLSSSEFALLETIGITERNVQAMVEQQTGYMGPRTGISADGTWMFLVTGGD